MDDTNKIVTTEFTEVNEIATNETSELASDEIKGNTYECQYANTNYRHIDPDEKKKKKHSNLKSLIAIGMICSILGGTAATFGTLYMLPNTKLFKNTPLFESLNNNSNSTSPISSPVLAKTGSLSVAEIAKKVGPAVVGVSTKSVSSSNGFFGSNQTQEGMGSGIIINEEGYILTNYHVIDGAKEVKIIFSNNKEAAAKIVNYDEAMDLAVVQVADGSKMPAVAELGSSKDLQVGDPVIAIGNPLGKELLGSVTSGIVSAANREITVGNTKQTLIQTDAAINRGNSGGALVNAYGQVIGINSAKMGGDGVEGLGFAIPIDLVKPEINNLLKPILKIGIAARSIDTTLAKQYDLPEGLYVVQVQEFSPAEKAGLQQGDVITSFDGKKVKTVEDLNKIKSEKKSGDSINIEISRNGKNKTLALKLTE